MNFENNSMLISILTLIVAVGLFYLLGRFVIKPATQNAKKILSYAIIALAVLIVLFCTFINTKNFMVDEILIAVVGAMAGLVVSIVTSNRGKSK
jgi:prepilin signal peptidase PulO-like enzyme (type II secretory pathway)